MHSEAAKLPIIAIDDDKFHNIIPSRFPTVRLYERIADGRDELFAKIEEITNPRVREKDRLTRGMAAVDQDQPRFKNWNHAPFVYPNPEGSRFFGANRNVLELAGCLQTALAISVAKRELFLSRTAQAATYVEMRQFVRPVRGTFIDARGWDGQDDRERCLALGKEVDEAGRDGLLFSPRERRSATGITVLKPECLGRPIQAEHFKYMWNGERITLLYAFGTGQEYDPQDLSEQAQILAA
ncbi:RES domain-containing protein [Sphingopyxis sp. H115]|uniref:RES domain-containing protein n=1 Tax=Sphingopyxis sp. H115 TaxID=1759073 RepID=UPI00073739DA|nr:RES domain-containing protein [Sphingopyxis sp. H115]KTE16797.1 hypothetical protein ATE71_04330 [Sphingopyxis sp. H115]